MNKTEQTSENNEQGNSSLGVVVCCAKCGEKITDEMLREQKDEIEMELDVLCKKHWEDDRLYMAELVMY